MVGFDDPASMIWGLLSNFWEVNSLLHFGGVKFESLFGLPSTQEAPAKVGDMWSFFGGYFLGDKRKVAFLWSKFQKITRIKHQQKKLRFFLSNQPTRKQHVGWHRSEIHSPKTFFSPAKKRSFLFPTKAGIGCENFGFLLVNPYTKLAQVMILKAARLLKPPWKRRNVWESMRGENVFLIEIVPF